MTYALLLVHCNVVTVKWRENANCFDKLPKCTSTDSVFDLFSAPMTAIVLAKENGVKEWRELMGPTKTYRAKEIAPTSIRALYGISDTRNAAHGSDSDESARKEISFFFPEFCFDHWLENHEPFYREKRDQLVWCEERGIHHYAGT